MAIPAEGRIGTAVLVHGGWGNPEDWQWVAHPLTAAGVEVVLPDLPSHRTSTAGILDDVAEVRRSIAGATLPVVLVGWSYGGGVITRTAAEEPSVTHLVYVSSIPEAGIPEGMDADLRALVDQDPHIHVSSNGTFLLDNDWWLDEEAGATFPPEVREELHRHPRRPSTLGTLELPPTSAVWETVPTTVLLGRDDPMIPAEARESALALKAQVRLADCDHFIVFRQPELVSSVVLRALATD